jgi:protein-S-isoprenylcysteine O-methyltransferase Ste14
MTNVMVDSGRTPLTLGAWAAYADSHARVPARRRFTYVTLTTVVFSVWAVFWICWLIAAVGAKQSVRTSRFRRPGLVLLVGVVLLRVFRTGTLAVNTPILQVLGLILFAAGLGLAVWARIYLGRNWGMPMTERAEPELVTSGPYRFVRHPIYSGLLLALLGTALATNLYWLIALVLLSAYFIYSATVEERLLTTTFPADYASYKAHSKMLIPFVL